MLNFQVLEANDFSGGKTDNYIAGDPTKFKEGDNLVLTPHKKLLTRPGSELIDADNTLPGYLGTSGRHSALMSFQDQLFELSGRHLYYNDGTYNELVGPSSNPALSAGDATSYYPSWAFWNDHMLLTNDALGSPMKVYKDETDVFQVRTMGMPPLANAPVGVGTAGANNYIYRFVYFYEYQIGTVVFQDFGPVTEVEVSSVNAPNVNQVAFTGIPVISNGATENYETTAIRVYIYRTQNNGTTFTYVADIANGTTTYNDNASDASIVDNTSIYTEGGVVDNDPPPAAKYISVANDIAWYGHVKEGASTFKNRIRQSNKYDIDSCPTDFFMDVEDEIVGMGAVGIYPMVFCKNRIYRLEGFYDLLGRGGIDKREISRTVGCASNLGIINVREGIFFAGNDGFYFTDGYSVQRITDELVTTYQALVDSEAKKKRIYGVFDNVNELVHWAVQRETAAIDVDSTFVLDLRWGVRPTSTFTTWSGSTSFAPSAMVMHQNQFIRGDRRGYAFIHDNDTHTDPRVDTLTDASLWETQTIIYDYESCALNFGTDAVRKWVPSIITTVDDTTNISVALNSQNDDSALYMPLKNIISSSQLSWGDPLLTWEDPDLIWNFNELLEANRRYPAGGLRCSYKQMQYTNAYITLYNSDDFADVAVNSSARTVTLVGTWPDDVVDYYISFEDDDFDTEFLIATRTATVLTVTDPLAELPNTTLGWVIRGYKKGDVMNLISYVIRYALLTDSQTMYKGANGQIP